MTYLRSFVIVVLTALIFFPHKIDAQARPKIIVGYASMSSVATTLWVTQEKGFFAKNGLDVQTIFIPGSPTLIATLNTGEVQIGYTGGTATLGAAVGGLDLKIVASFGNFVQTDLVVRPDIKTPAELKGKRIGVTSIGGTGWMSAMLGLEQIGLNPERDGISLAAFGDQRVITQALETGTIQGACVSGIFSRKLKRAGFNFLGDLEKIPLVGTSIIVKADYLASHQAIVRSALRALMEGHGYVLNPTNKASVMEIMNKKLGMTDQVAANDGYDDYVRRTDKKGFVVLDGLKNIQRFMKLRNPKIGDINLERMIDESILRDLEKSGFLEQALSGKIAAR
ncbi:MAG TPA: ABC transporter substrate-binding protein [Terriglobales bacterium]|jgi:ABC-type nitrate/sulfonate/bicarbonate transport system substrate-binding protein|nr:ABC transporter substrate-binding protein [Terriglobales bacterium]